LRRRLAALETRLANLEARRGELERELTRPLLYEPAAKPRLLSLMAQKHRLDADFKVSSERSLQCLVVVVFN